MEVDPLIILGYVLSFIVLIIGIAYSIYKDRRGD
jgi:hypothetical protein